LHNYWVHLDKLEKIALNDTSNPALRGLNADAVLSADLKPENSQKFRRDPSPKDPSKLE
jgi:phage I-like protein